MIRMFLRQWKLIALIVLVAVVANVAIDFGPWERIEPPTTDEMKAEVAALPLPSGATVLLSTELPLQCTGDGSPYGLAFASQTVGTTLLPHEIENYYSAHAPPLGWNTSNAVGPPAFEKTLRETLITLVVKINYSERQYDLVVTSGYALSC